MSFLSLPVELVSKILTGMAIADLLHVTRTASYPRAVCLADRQIWRFAVNSEMLPLPVGKTLDSIELPLLLCCAARAMSIAKALQAPTIVPRRAVELTGLYDFNAWKFCRGEVPSRCQILPGRHSFLIGGRWLGLFDIRGTYAHRFSYNDRRVAAWAWESHDNGDSIALAIVWRDARVEESCLCTYSLQYDSDSGYLTAPKISLASVTKISPLPIPVHACMRNSIILIWNTPQWDGGELLIFDLIQQKRVRIIIPDDSEFQIVHAGLHPRLPVVVAVVAAGDESCGDVPFALEFIEVELQPIISAHMWEIGFPHRRRIAELGTFPYPRKRGTDEWNLRIDEDEIILHQLVTTDALHRVDVITRCISTNGALPAPVRAICEELQSDNKPFGFTLRFARNGHSRCMTFALRRNDATTWNFVQAGKHGILTQLLVVPEEFLDWGTIGVDEINGILIFATNAKTFAAYC
ncbi:hypothetical protein DFH06DRAFT_1166161 [Mycena polygramma]|nr:hypothetical protein DFH06DRAFT_1166161 [Mycena polygramma]